MNVNDEYGLPAGAQASQLYTNPQSLWGEQRPADRQNRSLQATVSSCYCGCLPLTVLSAVKQRKSDQENLAQIESMVGSIEPGENREDLLKDERHTAGPKTIGRKTECLQLPESGRILA
eukprot:1792685-Rhodomonas_salina.1